MMHRRAIVLATAGLVVALLAAALILWRPFATRSSPVALSTAVHAFKRAAGGGTTGPPRPGVYSYTLHGKECATVLGLPLCRAFPSRARMILTRKPGTIAIEIDYSQDHLEASRYTVRPDGLYLAWQRTRLVFGITQDDAMSTVPATLALPSAPRVGQHWTQRFSAGGLPVVTTDQVKRQSTLIVGGAKTLVYEIVASSTIGGAHAGTETDITWHAPGSGLDVRLQIHRKIGGAFPYTMDVDATLLSLKPLQ
jgi:hypothetical protein